MGLLWGAADYYQLAICGNSGQRYKQHPRSTPVVQFP